MAAQCNQHIQLLHSEVNFTELLDSFINVFRQLLNLITLKPALRYGFLLLFDTFHDLFLLFDLLFLFVS